MLKSKEETGACDFARLVAVFCESEEELQMRQD